MVVTQLNLEFRFQGKKLRGFSCELTRSPHGVFPETVFTTMCQVTVPILLSGLGMMAAGLIMNIVQVRSGHQRGSGNRVEAESGTPGTTDGVGQGYMGLTLVASLLSVLSVDFGGRVH